VVYSPERQHRITAYRQFAEACRLGHLGVMRQLTAPDFSANFPGQGWLGLDGVATHFARLLEISSDFATSEVKQAALDENVLYVRYELSYHIGDKLVTIMCVDEVVFADHGEIKNWQVFYDRVAAREQGIPGL